jgi:hypothetical protein
MSMSLLLALVAVTVVVWVARRDHHTLQTARRCLLDDCTGLLEHGRLTHGSDSFPKLTGSYGGRDVRADLIPDTMTIRRLPQLWLSASLLERNAGVPGLDILVRANGNEFYALSNRFARRFEAPPGLPAEVLIRGDVNAGRLLAEIAPALEEILSDARVKEVAITERGVRIVRQVGEGKRGEHLLLRQAHFDDAYVRRADFVTILRQLQSLRAIATTHGQVRAA